MTTGAECVDLGFDDNDDDFECTRITQSFASTMHSSTSESLSESPSSSPSDSPSESPSESPSKSPIESSSGSLSGSLSESQSESPSSSPSDSPGDCLSDSPIDKLSGFAEVVKLLQIKECDGEAGNDPHFSFSVNENHTKKKLSNYSKCERRSREIIEKKAPPLNTQSLSFTTQNDANIGSRSPKLSKAMPCDTKNATINESLAAYNPESSSH